MSSSARAFASSDPLSSDHPDHGRTGPPQRSATEHFGSSDEVIDCKCANVCLHTDLDDLDDHHRFDCLPAGGGGDGVNVFSGCTLVFP